MSMSWAQTSPDVFERKRGFMGGLYHQWAYPVGKLDGFGPTSTVRFKHRGSADNIEQLLRNAWIQVWRRFPTLAAISVDEGIRVHIQDDDKWLSETFLVHPHQTADEFLARKIKYRTAVLHYFPATSEINLDLDHQYIDGRGFAFFWDGFFTALETPDNSEKPDMKILHSRLPRSMEDMLGVPLESTDMGKTIVKQLLGKMASEAGAPITMPVDLTKKAASTRRLTVKLDEDTTNLVLGTAKSKGWSVAAAYQAAVILTVQELQRAAKPDAVGDTYSTESFFDMRRYYPEDFDPHQNPIVGCHCVIPCTTKTTDKTYEDMVTELTGFFRAGFDSPAIKDIWKEAYPEMAKIMGQHRSGPAPADGTTPSISNIGSVDGVLKRDYGQWEIEDYYFFISVGTPVLPIALWTWRGRMHIRACFNDGFYTTEEIEQLLNRSRDIFLENLGL